jgi:hypothetical protein
VGLTPRRPQRSRTAHCASDLPPASVVHLDVSLLDGRRFPELFPGFAGNC